MNDLPFPEQHLIVIDRHRAVRGSVPRRGKRSAYHHGITRGDAGVQRYRHLQNRIGSGPKPITVDTSTSTGVRTQFSP